MPIVQNLVGNTLPDVYLIEKQPVPVAIGKSTGTVGIVGQSTYGVVGEAVLISSTNDFVQKFGNFLDGLDGFMSVYNILRQGCTQIKFVRVTDGDELKATADLVNGSSGIVTFAMRQPGTEGNNATVTVSTGTISGKVTVTLKFLGVTYNFTNVDMNPNSSQYLVDLVNNANIFCTATRVSATGNLVNPATGTTTFSGGLNGTDTGDDLDDSEYVGTVTGNSRTGLKVFETEEGFANIICSARSNDTVNDELITQASEESLTPRMAVIAPEYSTTTTQLKTAMAAIDSPNVIMTYPHLKVYNPYTKTNEYWSSAPFYAGVLSVLSYNVSPSRQPVNGVIGTEVTLTRAEVQDLMNYRVSPITLLANHGGYVIRNGLTTSSNTAKRQSVRQRAMNYFSITLESSAQPFVSKGHTPQLRQDFTQFLNSFFERELRAGRIGNSNGGKAYFVKCDAENNPTAVVQANQLVADVAVSLIAIADDIVINLDASEENTNVQAN